MIASGHGLPARLHNINGSRWEPMLRFLPRFDANHATPPPIKAEWTGCLHIFISYDQRINFLSPLNSVALLLGKIRGSDRLALVVF